MFGPGAYRPDPSEGITAIANLPQPEIVSYSRRACSHFSGQASSKARCEVAICFKRFHRPAL